MLGTTRASNALRRIAIQGEIPPSIDELMRRTAYPRIGRSDQFPEAFALPCRKDGRPFSKQLRPLCEAFAISCNIATRLFSKNQIIDQWRRGMSVESAVLTVLEETQKALFNDPRTVRPSRRSASCRIGRNRRSLTDAPPGGRVRWLSHSGT
jgi:hypothetical protein